MTPETEAFLARVRHAELPTADVEQRVLAAVQAAVATPAASHSPRPSAAAGAKTALGAKASLKLVLWIAGFATTSVVVQPANHESRGVGSMNGRSVTEHPAVRRVESPQLPAALAEVAVANEAPRSPAPPLRTPKSGASNLQAELALLADVHAALRRGDGEGALRRLDAHHTRDRKLVVERRAARVLALCAAGRVREARSAAEEFMREHPNSPQRLAVERACVDARRD